MSLLPIDVTTQNSAWHLTCSITVPGKAFPKFVQWGLREAVGDGLFQSGMSIHTPTVFELDSI